MQKRITPKLNNPSYQEQLKEIQIQQSITIQQAVTQAINVINTACNFSIRTLNQFATNLAYTAKHSACPFIQRKAIVLGKGCEPAYLLGKKYLYKDREKFEEAFRSIIWICYRSELEGKSGDVGWGCMIRVCQMVLAQALKICNPHMHASQIIKQFSSSNEALFSFDKICIEGKIIKRWTSSSEIIIILQNLLKQQDKFKLKIEIYNIHVSQEDIGPEEKYPLLLIVNNRLGLNKVEQSMRDHLNTVLENKRSTGMITGIGGEAIYVVGYYEDQLIALDPHYVQSESQGQKNYSSSIPRGVPLHKIVPAVGLCFFFQNAQQHQQWLYDLAESCHFYRPSLVIECDQNFCKEIYEQRHPKKLSCDQQFQILQ